jgi:hypothetical protein
VGTSWVVPSGLEYQQGREQGQRQLEVLASALAGALAPQWVVLVLDEQPESLHTHQSPHCSPLLAWPALSSIFSRAFGGEIEPQLRSVYHRESIHQEPLLAENDVKGASKTEPEI